MLAAATCCRLLTRCFLLPVPPSSFTCRFCSEEAYFCVKEIDLAIVADVGTTQRLPVFVGDQRAREMTYTGRNVPGVEAARIGLALECHPDAAAARAAAVAVATQIAAKSPVTVRGAKKAMLYARDHPVADALEQVKTWNGSALLSEDLGVAMRAAMQKQAPDFRD